MNTTTNSLGMAFARIEPGTFRMGGDDVELADSLIDGRDHLRRGDWDEYPAHDVTISRAFLMATHEVTNAIYEQFDPTHRDLRGKTGFSVEDDEAVVYVTWHDAVRFCAWLTEKEGKPYRLPTEAEWEYACRAGTTTPFHTGADLPAPFLKNARESWYPDEGRSDREEEVVPLAVGQTTPNAWGLHDMHGNVEEWCLDWYGPHEASPQTDPVGRASGDFRVTRGGSHGTLPCYLRSANRAGALPADRSWLIGFRVVQAESPEGDPLPELPPRRWQIDVGGIPADVAVGRDPAHPYFAPPRRYVFVPEDAEGPLFGRHNHDTALVACANGDLLAIWYSCVDEPGRELAIAASRLRRGQVEWDPADLFWDAPDRNDHAPALWRDEEGRLHHFNGMSAAATWGNLATIHRTSSDHGVTWSAARLILPEHRSRQMPIESVFRTQSGAILLPCDAVTTGEGGTATWLCRDGEWTDPGGAVAGIHGAIVQLKDGRLMGLGRGDNIDDRMPVSLSEDEGRTWSHRASPFPPISGGQRCNLLRLREGPVLFVSFTGDRREPRPMPIRDESGSERIVYGLFAAVSEDEGESWSNIRLVSDDGPGTGLATMDGIPFTMSFDRAEPGGYMSVTQSPDGLIHLISSRLHYSFNLAWLRAAAPSAERSASTAGRR